MPVLVDVATGSLPHLCKELHNELQYFFATLFGVWLHVVFYCTLVKPCSDNSVMYFLVRFSMTLITEDFGNGNEFVFITSM